MKTEFTDLELKEIVSGSENPYRVELAIALLEERTEREKNPGVWSGAPEWATVAEVSYVSHESKMRRQSEKVYTRTLPKTKIDEIAERAAKNAQTKHFADLESIIRDALKEYEGNI